MAKLLLILVALASVAYVSAIFPTSSNLPTGVSEPLATRLSQWLVDTLSRKFVAIARFLNLKLRLVRFLVALLTTENLVLLRNLLEEALSWGTFTIKFLPESTDDPSYWWIPALTEFANQGVGDAGLFGLALGPLLTGNESNEEPSGANETNPPIYFNVPLSTTSPPEVDTEMEKRAENEEEFWQRDERDVISLDKLINAGRNDY